MYINSKLRSSLGRVSRDSLVLFISRENRMAVKCYKNILNAFPSLTVILEHNSLVQRNSFAQRSFLPHYLLLILFTSPVSSEEIDKNFFYKFFLFF